MVTKSKQTFNSQVTTNMGLSPYEIIFGIKAKKPILFHLSPTTDSFGNCNPTHESSCHCFPKHTHTLHIGLIQIFKRYRKELEWNFLNREKNEIRFL